MFYILRKVDQELYDVVSDGGLQPMPIFTTSWILTFFSHDVERYESVQRIYDIILAEHPLFIVYLVVATILLYKEELVENAEEY